MAEFHTVRSLVQCITVVFFLEYGQNLGTVNLDVPVAIIYLYMCVLAEDPAAGDQGINCVPLR